MTLESNFMMCVDGFDARVGAAVNVDRVGDTNAMLGGLAVGANAGRILFTNGLIDPWHALSVLPPNATGGNAAILINDGAHCRQMQPSRPDDPADVKAARAQAATILAGWLQ